MEPGWELYRSFLAVLREGSLSGAARRLGLTQPTVGRHIAALEAALALPLFTRSQQGLGATEAALALRPHAEALQAAADALVRAASGRGSAVAGAVRITASEIVAAEVLPPILARLRAAHPRLVIELVATNRTEDLSRREADIAVRMVRPTQGALVARRIGAVEIGLYAHRDHLARAGTPRTLAACAEGALIGFDRETEFTRSLRPRGLALRRDMFALRCDSDLVQLAALRAGFGIGACQIGIARRDPALVRLVPRDVALQLELWLAMHQDLRAHRGCRVTFDALAEGLAAYVASAAPRRRAARAGP